MTGVVMLAFGLIGKVGALLSTVPDPVLGGITIPALGMYKTFTRQKDHYPPGNHRSSHL